MRLAGRICFLAIGWSLLVGVCAGKATHKAKDEACLACHADATLTKEVIGKTVSLQVDGEKFKHSVHGSMLGCVDCHANVKAEPHETTPKKVACVQCHAEQQQEYKHSFHAKAH